MTLLGFLSPSLFSFSNSLSNSLFLSLPISRSSLTNLLLLSFPLSLSHSPAHKLAPFLYLFLSLSLPFYSPESKLSIESKTPTRAIAIGVDLSPFGSASRPEVGGNILVRTKRGFEHVTLP